MPIASDSNFPTVPGFMQSVSFHLLRNGDPVDLEDATYIVENIDQLDAHLALVQDTSTDTSDQPGYSRAEVLIRSKFNSETDEFERRDEYVVYPDGSQQATSNITNPSTSWISFVYTDEFDPSSDIPCADGIESNRYASLVLTNSVTLGEERLGFLITLDSDQDTALFSGTETVDLTGEYKRLEDNSRSSGCTLADPFSSTWPIVGIAFNANDYPRAETSDPLAKVKLLWLAGYKSANN